MSRRAYRRSRTFRPTLLALHAGLGLGLACGLVQAQEAGPSAAAAIAAPSPFGDGARPVGDEALGEMRGGFTTDGGLQVSFGIDRAVYVDGNLVAQTHLEVNQLGQLSAGGVQSTPVAGNVAVLQGGTVLQTIPLPQGVATVIQNAADSRQLQSVTSVNAVVNSLALWHRLDVQTAVSEGLVGALQH